MERTEMQTQSFWKVGHWPTLMAAFLYFDVSFMVWVLLGPLAPAITQHLHMNATQKGLLVALPLLGGAFFRPILGALCDRFGGRRIGLLGLTMTLVPLFWGWRYAAQPWHFYALGFLLGIAGASFAVALPLASKWYPSEYQGRVMGIAGAGNSGTLLATLFAPRLAKHFGWANTFVLAALPVLCVLVLFALLAKDSPTPRKAIAWKEYKKILSEPDTLWMCLLYSLTFGGFVGLASFLTLFFHDQYHLSAVRAGDFTTLVVFAGSYLRPVGGWLSDKLGGYRLLIGIFLSVGICMGVMGRLPAFPLATALLFVVMSLLGMGNGAVFQLVPLRFPAIVGVITGLVGAAGGIGGFFLPSTLGMFKDRAGSYGAGFDFYAVLFFLAAPLLLELGRKWHASWREEVVAQAGIFSYRNPVERERPSFAETAEAVAE
jgi:NNP family nitrate/nitrite transporter-like MFS transporter